MTEKRFRRTHPLGNYLLLLLFTGGTFWLYSFFVVPAVEVSSQIERSLVSADEQYPILPDNLDYQRWFKKGDWEIEPCSILHTAHGKILFQDFEAEDPQTWFVKPFSLVLEREEESGSEGKGSLPPLILRCEKGARLSFDSPILANIKSTGNRLESAFLEGQVELYRLAASPDKNDAIRIETSNVQITDEQILTIDDVGFWFGPNQGIGRNLLIQMAHSTPKDSVTKDFSKINGIQSLQLGFLSSLRLQPGAKPSKEASDRLMSTDKTAIEITAAGSFELDMDANTARFIDRVQVRKLDSSGDVLNCDELMLEFKTTNGAQMISLDAATDTEFELESITAIGKPAVLTAHSQDARVAAEKLEYDLTGQTIKADGGNQVDIRKGTSQFVAKSVLYRLMDNKTLGPLHAKGPGILVRVDGERSFRASWENELSVERQSDQQHRIHLASNAEVQLDDKTSIRADELSILIWEVPVFDQTNQFVRWSYQPDKLVAENRVRILSEKVIGNTNRLIADWPSNPKAAQQTLPQIGLVPSSPESTLVESSQAAYSHVRRVNYDQTVNPEPLTVVGQQINVVLEEQGGKTEIADLNIEGSVIVSRSSDQRDTKSFKVQGNSLKLVPQGKDIYQIRVAGTAQTPASIESDRLELTGPRIILDQLQNRMWVRGTGQLKIENVEADTTVRSNDDRVDVSFQGGMVFDGLKVYFERNVTAQIKQSKPDGTVVKTHMTAAALSLTLDRRFDFQNQDRPKAGSETNPKIVEMILRDSLPLEKTQFKLAGFKSPPKSSVVINSQTVNAAGNVVERISVSAPHAEIDERSQSIIAHGPGSVELVRPGSSGSAPNSFGLNPGKVAARRSGLTYIQTKFDQQLVANTKTNEIVITGNTRSIYSSVQDVNQSFDPDRPRRLPDDAIRLTCQRIDMSQTRNGFTGEMQNSFVATGNARILSATFDAAADLIRYLEEQDLLLVESTTGRDVLLRFRSDPKTGWKDISGKKLIYRISTQSARMGNVGHIAVPLEK